MASLKASSSSAMARGLRNGKATANCISSLRVKPFTQMGRNPAIFRQPSTFRVRAAEVEEPQPEAEGSVALAEPDFEFNEGDAKKNNSYEPSDVEAAMRFYYEGAAAPPANDDFVTNMFGGEDASFFDDVDNEDDGDWDEYAIAGIAEAAPKKGGSRGSGEEGAGDADDDNDAKGKKLAMLQAMEDQMVLDADMEDVYGNQTGSVSRQADDADSSANDIWNWLGGETTEDVEVSTPVPTTRYSDAVLPSDDEVFSAFSALKVDELDEQTRDMLELIIGDDPSDLDLTANEDAAIADAALPASETFTDAERATLDLLIQYPLSDPAELEELMPEDTDIKVVQDEDAGVAVSEKSLQSYITSLNQAANNDSDLSMSYEQITDMFNNNNVAIREDKDTTPALDISAIIASDPELPPKAELDLNTDFGAIEVGDAEIQDIKDELRSLAAIDQFTEFDMPDDQQIEILDQYLNAVEQLDAQEAKGDELIPDLETEYADDLIADLAESNESRVDVVNYDVDEDDGETWLERVIELTRVTKVTKGGKVIGFRCTAVVGNQKGLVGVGCQSGVDIGIATKRALVDAKRNAVRVPLVAAGTVPHISEAKFHAARVILVPAADGTGVIAGGSIKAVLELAGVQNVLAKRLGCRSLLNNARCTVKALQQLRTLYDVSKARGVPMEHLLLPRDA